MLKAYLEEIFEGASRLRRKEYHDQLVRSSPGRNKGHVATKYQLSFPGMDRESGGPCTHIYCPSTQGPLKATPPSLHSARTPAAFLLLFHLAQTQEDLGRYLSQS